jgi:carboxypeptidase C (cathepsin A)
MARTTLLFASLAVTIAGVATNFAWADDGANAVKTQPTATVAEVLKPTPDAVSRHEIDVGGQRIAYTATAGTLPLRDSDSKVTAHIFYTAYAAEATSGPRPVTFVFNGGPGAASAFLHIGALGPRVIPFNEKGSAALHPVRLVDNDDTWLQFTDLVFIDPVGTGYSRGVGPQDKIKDKFFSIDKDADSMSEFARLYLTRTSRLLDPVFLAGESYGGFRTILVAKRLLHSGFDVRGAVLVSPVIEFSLIRGDALAILPIALSLPSIACAHFEIEAGMRPDAGMVKEIEAFARGRYIGHLTAGMRDDPQINETLARFTGLPVDRIAHQHGRVSVSDFTKAFRQSQDRALSLYDGSVSVALPVPANRHHSDPILDYAVSVLSPAFAAYARDELGYATDLAYDLLNRNINKEWDFGSSPQHQGYAGALDDLQEARTQRPSLRILIAAGYTDLVTPFAVSRYLIDQMKPIHGAMPVEMKVYPGGHMMYLRASSRTALAADARARYGEAMRFR